ncbi:helix-turn-helix domain-containing protein [Pseudomonas cichorii]|uniref:helix-turn-helix domain-containing protein n=1 Tax=Pseudomonas cichorii TaxID=36746 RepID=UPI001C8A29F8|nr:helix-turn-helix transcriptional regulator [Pseudomonas cichorii]MBX8573811.1 helix-turn-helix domain-containing protein [Pseudomonas cichorii]
MELKQAFGAALRRIRKNKDLTQEDFSQVSSRTYLSTLERGLKSPTLEKIEELASVLDVHPLTILTSCYLLQDKGLNVEELFHRVRGELTATRAN